MTSGRTAVTSTARLPDGRALAVQLDAVCPEVFIVPADAEGLSVGDSFVPAGALLLRQIEAEPRNVCAFSRMSWRN